MPREAGKDTVMTMPGRRTMGTMRRTAITLAATASLAVAAPAQADPSGRARITAGGTFSVPVVSYSQRFFRTVIRQQYDYSCGSAAVATLLTYHYGVPTSEQEAFKAMWDAGNQARIRKVGFSLFDIKRFVESRGFKADGFRLPLETVVKVGVPAIALIQTRGYRHFVVLKGSRNGRVLVGDPARGILTYSREQFEEMRIDNVVFMIRSHVETGRQAFNRVEDWSLRRAGAPLGVGVGSLGFDMHSHLARIPAQPFPALR